MSRENIAELLKRYQEGQCTDEEKQLVDKWFIAHGSDQTEFGKMDDEEQVKWTSKLFADITKTNFKNDHTAHSLTSTKLLWKKIAVAAAVLLISAAGVLFFLKSKTTNIRFASNQAYEKQIAPGGNKAFLTLADGSRISLTDVKNGNIAKESGIEITKTADGQLIYESKPTAETVFGSNTISTPKGGQYQVRLPDGTKVWLNAASSLTYPASFVSAKERKVELNGEAYFEVSKDKLHPFIVKTAQQQIEVLGTHFNINSYADEPTTNTTLLEGAIRIQFAASKATNDRNNIILKSGEQAILQQGAIRINEVDTELSIDWKNGEFAFRNEDLQSIMRKVSRWYNVEIVYKDAQINQRKFSGTLSRFEDVSKLLNILKLTGDVTFKVEGHKIIVMD